MARPMKARLLTTLCVLLWPTFTLRTSIGDDRVHVDQGNSGMVVSESALASRVGRDALINGGNAVDAAVATAFALAVTWPEAGNIGGGGFMMVRPADGKSPMCIDYRETAPSKMNATSFQRTDHTYSQKAVGVPGTVRGLATAHQKYGQRPWRDLVMPAVALAKNGFQVTATLAGSVNSILAKDDVRTGAKYAELRRVYGKSDGSPWQAGDRMQLPDLAATLTMIAEAANAFYSGPLAKSLVQEMRRGDGIIDENDLRHYEAKIRPAMTGTFRGFTILGAPPPSSGGTCIIEALNILENFDLASRDRFDATNVHLIAETCRRVFADRARYLGDPEFTEIPEHLTTKAYAKQLAATIDPTAATLSETVAPEIQLTPEGPDTTHFSVIDANGMAVSNTYTLEASWGSRIVVTGRGYVLNNEMGDFNWFPGETNRSGRIGTKANLVVGGKRMLSSQSPSLVEKDGKLVLITGSPGGRTIINTVLCNILNVTEFGMDAAAAITAARQHHQWFPDRIYLEDIDQEPHASIALTLRTMGHEVVNRNGQGSAHSIAVDPATGTIVGVSDRRRDGRPAAVSAGTLAIWDFSEAADQELTQTFSAGRLSANWTSSIPGCLTDGKDQLRIRRKAPNRVFSSFVPLGSSEVSQGQIVVTVKIDRAEFAGTSHNEQLRIGFTHDNGKPRVTARIILGRDDANNVIIRGEALGGGSEIPPTIIATEGLILQPIILRLTVDVDADSYEIASRQADVATFTVHGTGRIAAERVARYLRLSVLNDFSASGEFVSVDRIHLLRP